MNNLGINIYQYAAEKGKGWVVSRNQIAYLKPAFLMERVVIESATLKLDEKEVLVEMRMLNERKDKLKSVMWSQFVHIDMKTQKPVPHDEEIMKIFIPVVQPLSHAMSFEERIDHLRK